MTADERIEKLLNYMDNTMSDLPDAKDIKKIELYKNLLVQAERYVDDDDASVTRCLAEYALHLTDVIDRLEWALSNAKGNRSVELSLDGLVDITVRDPVALLQGLIERFGR